MNAFLPATEVDDPELFAGRNQQVRELTDSLHMIGSTPLIYGHRGLGKSSLALQIRRIAMGDVELLNLLGAIPLSPTEEQQFLTFYVTCTSATETFTDLLQRLINSAESVEFVKQGGNDAARQLIDRTTRRKLTLKIFELESTKKYQTEAGRLSYQDLNLEEKLLQLAEILTDTYGQPVLFIIDELDKMKDTAGMASFLKAVSSAQLKFMLVGIGSSLSELLGDHQSLERRLVPVHVPPMKRAELREIVRKAEDYLDDKGISIRFSQRATDRLARLSGGFPWFVHVLGQSALVATSDAGRDMVEDSDIALAVKGLVENRFAQQFADMYQNAVRDSYPRELVLRTFAQWSANDIPVGEIYRILKADLGVSNPSTYRGHLWQKQFGNLLYTPVFQKRGLLRFSNEMFKIYVRLRSSIYEDAAKRVDEAWGKRANS